jgi:hypothetical protein
LERKSEEPHSCGGHAGGYLREKSARISAQECLMKINLTDVGVRVLKPPPKGQITVWDKTSPFGVRVSQGGTKTYIIFKAEGQRLSLGRADAVSLTEARTAAKRFFAERTFGIKAPEPSSGIKFNAAVIEFIEEHYRGKKPRTPSTAVYRNIGAIDTLRPTSAGRTRMRCGDRRRPRHSRCYDQGLQHLRDRKASKRFLPTAKAQWVHELVQSLLPCEGKEMARKKPLTRHCRSARVQERKS